jgi:2-keto-myo-inositol isomerase
MPFTYSLNSSTIATTPLLDKIRIAAEVGYAAIEIWHSDVDGFVSAGGTVREVRRAIDDHGLFVPTTIFLKGWWDTTGDVERRAFDEIRRRLEQAAELGAEFAIAGPPLGPCDLDFGAERYAHLLEVGREFGVKPVFEYLGFSQDVNTIAAAAQVLERCGDSDATTVLDPFHCHRGGGGIDGISTLLAEKIAISHFNDAPDFPPRELQHDPDRVQPGEGVIDLNRYCDLLAATGFTGCLSIELFNRDLWRCDPRTVAAEGLRRMQAIAESTPEDTN